MGQELECQMRYGGRKLTGKAYLETDYVLFRGEERLKILLRDLTRVRAEAGILRLDFAGGPAELELGKASAKWAQKILHPPSRLDKLGVKAGMVVAVVGKFDAAFKAELRERGAVVKKAAVDLIFLAAERTSDLQQVRAIAAELGEGAAVWVVFPKGVKAIREIEVIEAGRAAGLKDTKVARFSETHTALRFNQSRARLPFRSGVPPVTLRLCTDIQYSECCWRARWRLARRPPTRSR